MNKDNLCNSNLNNRIYNNLIIFIDSGDTLVDESSEVRRTPGGVVYEAKLIPGARETLVALKEAGYTLVLVADGLEESFLRIYHQHDLDDIFDIRVISELVGEEKPSKSMFMTACNRLNLTPQDMNRVIMVGNNLKRDVAGANRMGITSVLMSWSPRYCMTPSSLEEVPDYTIQEPRELLALAETLEHQLEHHLEQS